MAGLVDRILAAAATGGISELGQDSPLGIDALNPGAQDDKKAQKAYGKAIDAWDGDSAYMVDENGDYILDENGNPMLTQAGGVRQPTHQDLSFSDEEVAAGFHQFDPLMADDGDYMGGFEANRNLGGNRIAARGMQHHMDVLDGDGFDAVAEADFARRRALAGQTRRANTDAVAREMELRGVGGSGMEAMGAMAAGQGQVSDEYMAGLGANAIMQQNRDNSANALTQGGHQQQQIQDQWDSWYADAANDNKRYDADKYSAYKEVNYDRRNDVRDYNADHRFGAYAADKTAKQQVFENQAREAEGKSGIYGAKAGHHERVGDDRFNPGKAVATAGGKYLEKAGG